MSKIPIPQTVAEMITRAELAGQLLRKNVKVDIGVAIDRFGKPIDKMSPSRDALCVGKMVLRDKDSGAWVTFTYFRKLAKTTANS